MNLSMPHTPLPGLQPPGAARGSRAFDGPKCVSKPHRCDLATLHVTVLASEAVPDPISVDLGALKGTKIEHFQKDGRQF